MQIEEGVEARVEARPRSGFRVSLVWLLPLLAVLFAAAVVYQYWQQRGPLISIQFASAGGIEPGITAVRRNEVVVGRVEAVELADDLNSVVIKARMDPRVEPWLDEDTRFWIVSAHVSATEISGLGTLLSGAYLEVDWNDTRGEPRDEFRGLEEAPLVRRSEPGVRVRLKADDASFIQPGSPVFYRKMEAGRVERRRLGEDGKEVLFDVFIKAPYDRHVYPKSLFYNVSGVEGRLDTEGVVVRVESVVALLTGGIGIENPPEALMDEPLASTPDATGEFRLYESLKEATDSFVNDFDDPAYRFSVRFSGSIKGLAPGAPVEYNGLRIGSVSSAAVALPETPGAEPIGNVVLQLQPQLLGIVDDDVEAFRDLMDELVTAGLRAELASGNILTGALMVNLVVEHEAAAAQLDMTHQPYPLIPSLPSNVEALTADVETIVANLAALPLDSLVASIIGLVDDARGIIGDPAMTALPGQLGDSLDSLANAAGRIEDASEDLPTMLEALTRASQNADVALQGLSPNSRIYRELSTTARELRQAARSIAAFAAYLERNPNALITGR
ncbi:MAG: hypothetical protein CSB44_11400 [Gammaproteobacteria bacterium]|nr:MAG: hypothetical protein CSB44_11400 [Gammaproteobacteria bacterium]